MAWSRMLFYMQPSVPTASYYDSFLTIDYSKRYYGVLPDNLNKCEIQDKKKKNHELLCRFGHIEHSNCNICIFTNYMLLSHFLLLIKSKLSITAFPLLDLSQLSVTAVQGQTKNSSRHSRRGVPKCSEYHLAKLHISHGATVITYTCVQLADGIFLSLRKGFIKKDSVQERNH